MLLTQKRVAAVFACCGAAALAAAVACGGGRSKPTRRAKQKVVVMGFDGMDPTLARQYMQAGKLPHLKQLADAGSFSTLQTTQPSESPVAWQSFITGLNPGKHGIFDFLTRDLRTYMPDPSMGVRREPALFKWGFLPTQAARATSTRSGTPFWSHAGKSGIGSVVLTVPMTFPAESVEHGDLLSGLPLPDIRGTLGFFSYWATDISSFEEGNTEMGGFVKRLLFEGGVSKTILKGPVNPILRQEEAALAEKKQGGKLSDTEAARLEELATTKDVNVPMSVTWTEGSGRAEIEIDGTRLALKAGEWSPWVSVTFPFNFLAKARGIVQFHVIRADKELQLYASPVNLDPRDPMVPITAPDDFSRRLVKQLGLFRTLGWAEPTWPLNDGRLDEAAFLYDSEVAFGERERTILKQLERDDWDLFVAAIETTDRVSHMMWRLIDPRHPMHDETLAARYGDAIEKVYRRADDLVGKIRAQLPPDAVLIVMSDHGFHSFRRGVNLNTWLVHNGYMQFEGQRAGTPPAELVGRGRYWEGVDWSRTRAYALGLGQIYFNLRGREAQGIVSAGAEYKALQDEIAARLVTLVDPDTGERVMQQLYRRDDIYRGDAIRYAPDLQAGFASGYRVGWQDTLGAIQRGVVENNNRKWSGDHCATAAEISGGVLFVNRKLAAPQPHIMDLAPTILALLDVPLPAELDGRSLFAAAPAGPSSVPHAPE